MKPLTLFEQETSRQVDRFARWSKASPGLRRWVEENRAALDLYRRGTERPDARDPPFGSSRDAREAFSQLHYFRFLALLQASRLEEQGDMAGAWGWYRAMLRSLHHLGMHSTAIRRLIAQAWHKEPSDRITTWAADPRTTPELLRRALADVVACESLAPSEADTLKAEYLAMERMLDDPKGPGPRMPPAWFRSMSSQSLTRPLLYLLMAYRTPDQIRSLHGAWRTWRREPERSRRGPPTGHRQLVGLLRPAARKSSEARPQPTDGHRPLRVRARGAGQGPRHVARGPGPMAGFNPRRPDVAPYARIEPDPER